GVQARMPDRRRHGAHEDRVPLPLDAQARAAAARPAGRLPAALRRAGGARALVAEPARSTAWRGAPVRATARALGATRVAEVARRPVPARRRTVRRWRRRIGFARFAG